MADYNYTSSEVARAKSLFEQELDAFASLL